ncbi:MAG: L,D-transpeptidase family protein [Polyangiaceae bacterium]|nr:L,D-transpeptidase family protein [Polyangiaceae bacterium]
MKSLPSPSVLFCLLATLAVASCDSSHRSTAQGASVARSSVSAFDEGDKRASLVERTVAPAESAGETAKMAAVEAKHTPEPARDVRMPTEWMADLDWSGSQRVAHAKSSKGAVVQKLFDDAGVNFPPHDVLYRVFKQEEEFEVWAGDEGKPLRLIATYGICAASGVLGPKRAEGDRQVPEGYYKVGYFHPASSYYLSAQVDYPNASDRLRGGPSPGGDILIHGRCASIGCVSMTDERIEEIYLVGWGAFMKGQPTHIHIFPARDFGPLLSDPKLSEHHAFWREIEPGLLAFDKTHRIPAVRIEKDGRYVVTPAADPEQPTD